MFQTIRQTYILDEGNTSKGKMYLTAEQMIPQQGNKNQEVKPKHETTNPQCETGRNEKIIEK